MKRRRIPRLLTSRPRGQTLAEFAGVSLVSLLLLFAIMEMAMAVNAYTNICIAAREAARYAVVHSPSSAGSPCPSTGCSAAQLQSVCTAIQAQAVSYAPFLSQGGGGCTTGEISVSFTNPPPASPALDYAVVTINHTYPLTIPWMAPVNLSLSSSSQMLVSQ